MTMTMSERGRLGGLACYRKHGAEHYRRLGRKGFGGLARRYRSRRAAWGVLFRKGKIADRYPDALPEAVQVAALEAIGEAGYRAATGADADDPPF